MTEKTTADFAAAVAAKVPAPGGGGVAAMVGAYGIALAEMTANFTLGKKKYAEYEDANLKLLARAEELRKKLLELVEMDAVGFEPLSRVYALPKATPGYDEKKDAAIEKACQAPLGMLRAISESIEILQELLKTGSRLMISDVGCGASCCRSALECAAMNLYVNTRIMSDRKRADELNTESEKTLIKYIPMADEIIKSVREQLMN